MKILVREKLSPHKYKTPEGYLICTDAILARTGSQDYRRAELFGDSCDDADEVVQLNRTADEVFSDKAMASFENKPIAVDHPDEDININNIRDYSVGFVRDIHKGNIDGNDVMLGTLVVTDKDAIDLIENGEYTDLSCGYDCDIDDSDGYSQKNIRGNHVALCREGRAGIARIIDSVDEVHKGFIFTGYEGQTFGEFRGFDHSKYLKVQTLGNVFIVYNKGGSHGAFYHIDMKQPNAFIVNFYDGQLYIHFDNDKYPDARSKIVEVAKKLYGVSHVIFDSLKDSQSYKVAFVYDDENGQLKKMSVKVEAQNRTMAIQKAMRKAKGEYDNASEFHIVDKCVDEESTYTEVTKNLEKKKLARDKCISDELIEVPKETITLFENELKKAKILIVDKGKTWSGREHYRIEYDGSARELASILNRISALLKQDNVPITYSVGDNNEGYAVGAVDLDKKWIPDKK